MAPGNTTTPERFKVVQYEDKPAAEAIADLPLLANIAQVVDAHLQRVGKQWRIRLWQAAVVAEILAGKDVVVKAQTGYGKSMCYQALAIMHPEDCVLIICPLLALMADQVKSARGLGINAVQLSAASMREDRNLLHKVRAGEYSMVLIAAEFIASEPWKALIRQDKSGRHPDFALSLRRIVVDEAHLVREWRVFRPHYRNIGLLRTRFSNVPIMACSATLPNDTLEYIHKSLHLQRPTVLCDMPADRPNISLFTVPIPKGLVDKRVPLLDLVPPEAAEWDCMRFDEETWSPFMIPKTLIFIDDRTLCCTLTTELIKRFPQHLANEAQVVISEYHSTLSAKALERNLQALQEGVCRIMVCTDAVGMGLDVPDIERIVQWRVPPWLTVSGWWQRAGRAARDPNLAGIAIVYYDPAMQVKSESPFSGRPDDEQELEAVYTACALAAKAPDGDVDDEGDHSSVAGMRRPKGDLPCEGELLWYLNTNGCLRDVAMHYLGSKSVVRPQFNEQGQAAPCCCRCYKCSDVSPGLFDGFDVRTCTPFVRSAEDRNPEFDEANAEPDSQMSTQSVPRSNRIRLAVRLALDVWRHQVRSQHTPSDNKLRPKHILPDGFIEKLEKHYIDIKVAADVGTVVSPLGRDILKHTRIAGHTTELSELILHVVSVATDPELPPRKKGTPWTESEPKPLYSASDIATAVNPLVARMMQAANSALRQFDLTAVNAKETTRQKRLKKGNKHQQEPSGHASTIAGTESVANSIAVSQTASVFSVATMKTDREMMPPPPLPPKRPRGRPLGSKNKVKVKAEGSVASEVPSLASSTTETSENGKNAVKPPKKRPKGHQAPSAEAAVQGAAPTSDSEQSKVQPEASMMNPEVGPDVPNKRRGRPPGSKNKPKDIPGDSPRSGLGLGQISAASQPPSEQRRGRGRPRGSKNKS